MLLIKIHLHLVAFLKKLLYRLLFFNKLKIGSNTTFRKGFTLSIEKNGRIKIGENCFFNNYCSIASMDEIEIGDGSIFGENIKIYDHNHNYKDINISIKDQGYNSAPIKIGRHCWIGSNVVILKGVEIGDNCVIGAGCVVYKSVLPNRTLINKQDIIEKTF